VDIKDLLGSTGNSCTICLCEYEDKDEIRVLHCKHAFHKQCIDEWISKYVNNCPLCRGDGVKREQNQHRPLSTHFNFNNTDPTDNTNNNGGGINNNRTRPTTRSQTRADQNSSNDDSDTHFHVHLNRLNPIAEPRPSSRLNNLNAGSGSFRPHSITRIFPGGGILNIEIDVRGEDNLDNYRLPFGFSSLFRNNHDGSNTNGNTNTTTNNTNTNSNHANPNATTHTTRTVNINTTNTTNTTNSTNTTNTGSNNNNRTNSNRSVSLNQDSLLFSHFMQPSLLRSTNITIDPEQIASASRNNLGGEDDVIFRIFGAPENTNSTNNNSTSNTNTTRNNSTNNRNSNNNTSTNRSSNVSLSSIFNSARNNPSSFRFSLMDFDLHTPNRNSTNNSTLNRNNRSTTNTNNGRTGNSSSGPSSNKNNSKKN